MEQKHKEIDKEIEDTNAAVINLSAHSTAHSELLTKHDAILEHNRGAQGITRSQGGIL